LGAAVTVAALSYGLSRSVGPAAAAVATAVVIIALSASVRGARARSEEAERHLRAAQDAVGMGTWTIDLTTNTCIASDSAWRLMGRAPVSPPIPLSQWASSVHPDDWSACERQAQQMLAKGVDNFEQLFRTVHPSGQIRWLWSRVSVERNESGAPVRQRGATIDVTDRTHAEHELQLSEEGFRGVFEGAGIGMALLDLDGRPFQCNRALVEMFGYSVAEHLGMTFMEFTHPDDVARDWQLYGELAAGKRDKYQLDKRYYHKDGRLVHGNLVMTLVRDSARRPKFAIGMVKDVTRRKQAEQALQESESRLQLVADGAALAITDSDLTSGKIFWNQRTFELFGYEPTSDCSITEQMWRSRVHPDDLDGVRQALARAKRERSTFNTEYRIVHADGKIMWLSAYGRYYHGDDGKAVRFVGMSLDITERKQAQEELREADRRKDEFLAVLAHELRNPLAPLRDGLRIFQLADIADPTLNKARQIMERQLSQMVRLIDDLLDVNRISRNKLELRRSDTTIGQILDIAVETCRPALEAASHRLTMQLPAEPIHLRADRVRLAQVFSNLLSNSSKYMHSGGEIRVTVGREGDDVVVAVADDGIGIAPEDLPRVFEMFAQVGRETNRQVGGLGIGLALVRRLVEMHGGVVTAASPGLGQGSTFCVRLTGSSCDAPADSQNAPRERVVPMGKKVLVTDDNEDAAASLALLLRLMGNEVEIAHDGVEALTVAERFGPDLIFMDVGMPRLDGLEATRQLRQTEWGKHAAIIAVTGWGQEADECRSRAAGVDYHLVKPVNPEALEEVLAGVQCAKTQVSSRTVICIEPPPTRAIR
jgi:PAS domain S-box-containing protein